MDTCNAVSSTKQHTQQPNNLPKVVIDEDAQLQMASNDNSSQIGSAPKTGLDKCPQEIFDLIIDYLGPQALLNARLAHPRFAKDSMSKLFETVTFSPWSSSVDSLIRVANNEPCDRFGTNIHAAQLVRRLVLEDVSPMHPAEIEFGNAPRLRRDYYFSFFSWFQLTEDLRLTYSLTRKTEILRALENFPNLSVIQYSWGYTEPQTTQYPVSELLRVLPGDPSISDAYRKRIMAYRRCTCMTKAKATPGFDVELSCRLVQGATLFQPTPGVSNGRNPVSRIPTTLFFREMVATALENPYRQAPLDVINDDYFDPRARPSRLHRSPTASVAPHSMLNSLERRYYGHLYLKRRMVHTGGELCDGYPNLRRLALHGDSFGAGGLLNLSGLTLSDLKSGMPQLEMVQLSNVMLVTRWVAAWIKKSQVAFTISNALWNLKAWKYFKTTKPIKNTEEASTVNPFIRLPLKTRNYPCNALSVTLIGMHFYSSADFGFSNKRGFIMERDFIKERGWFLRNSPDKYWEEDAEVSGKVFLLGNKEQAESWAVQNRRTFETSENPASAPVRSVESETAERYIYTGEEDPFTEENCWLPDARWVKIPPGSLPSRLLDP